MAGTQLLPKEVAGASDFSFVRESGGIEEYRLESNGLRLLFLEARAAPVAVLMLTYAVGSGDERSGFKGASHMLEHMMFKGTARFNKQQGTSIFDQLHPVGAQTNATTWLDRTNFFNLVPCSHLELAAEIEADRMRKLRIVPEELEAERGVVLNEHDLYAGDPLEQLNQAVWSAAFGEHPYGAPVIGSREDIRGLTRECLLEHYQRHYWPNNATVTVVGDVSREQVLDIVGRHFGHIHADRRRAGVGHLSEPAPEQSRERRIVVEQADQQGWVMLAYRAPKGSCQDSYALELLGGILAGSKLSRLFNRLVANGLAAGAWPGISRLKQEGLFQVQALLGASQDHQAVECSIREAIADIRNFGVSLEELDRARGRLRGQLLTARDGPLAIAMQLNEAIAAGDWTAYATAADRLDSVSVADVQRVAREYLVDARLTVGYLKESAQ